MTDPLPKWIQTRYALLWNRFKEKSFSHEDATNFIKEKKEVISVFLSDLKKAGWLDIKLDQNDSRKRMYKLKSPDEAIKEMKNETN